MMNQIIWSRVETVGSKRLDQLGSAIFAEVEEWKLEARQGVIEIIDLGYW